MASVVATAVLVAASGYELAVALGALSIGPESGEGAYGSGFVEVAAGLAIVLATVAALVCLSQPRADWWRLGAVTLASAVFVAVRLYSYDPYYAPTLRRMSDGGLVSPGWVFALIGFAVIVAAVARFEVRSGAALAALVLILCLGTALVENAGH